MLNEGYRIAYKIRKKQEFTIKRAMHKYETTSKFLS